MSQCARVVELPCPECGDEDGIEVECWWDEGVPANAGWSAENAAVFASDLFAAGWFVPPGWASDRCRSACGCDLPDDLAELRVAAEEMANRQQKREDSLWATLPLDARHLELR